MEKMDGQEVPECGGVVRGARGTPYRSADHRRFPERLFRGARVGDSATSSGHVAEWSRGASDSGLSVWCGRRPSCQFATTGCAHRPARPPMAHPCLPRKACSPTRTCLEMLDV